MTTSARTASIANGSTRAYARAIIADLLAAHGSADAIAAVIIGGSYSPGTCLGLPPHGYTIGGTLYSVGGTAPSPPLPRGHIGVFIGDRHATFPIRALAAEIASGAAQAALL